jgi:hypothetical protein
VRAVVNLRRDMPVVDQSSPVTDVQQAVPVAGEVKDDRLWCMHVSGMDDVHPAPDRATAQLWAVQFAVNHHLYCPLPHPYHPVMNFTVAEWPWSPEQHAASLAASIEANTWPVDPLARLTEPARKADRLGEGVGANLLAVEVALQSIISLDNNGDGARSYVTQRGCIARIKAIARDGLNALRPSHDTGSAKSKIPHGMKGWTGGDSAPDDWDGGAVWRDDGAFLHPHPNAEYDWHHPALKSMPSILAYTPINPTHTTEEELRKALEPFARLLDWYVDGTPDNLLVAGNAVGVGLSTVVTVADLRRARAALSAGSAQ